MTLTTSELQRGVAYWRARSKWPQDFHDRFYRDRLPSLGTVGVFNEQWWNRFYPVLWEWRQRDRDPVDFSRTASKIASRS